MTVTRVGAQTGGANATTATIPWPAGTQAGDVALLWWSLQQGTTPTDPAGFTLKQATDSSGNVESRFLVRVCDGSESGSITLTVATANKIGGVLAVYRGVDNTTPVDAFASRVETTAGTTHACPTITTVAANAVTLTAISERGSNSTTSFTPGSGYTLVATATSSLTGMTTTAVADDGLASGRAAGTSVTPGPWSSDQSFSSSNDVTWTVSLTPSVTPNFSGTGTATVRLAASGTGAKAASGTGTASLALAGSGSGSKAASGTGSAAVTFSAAGSSIVNITLAGQWTSTGANVDAEVITAPTAGDWLVAVVTGRIVDGSSPLINIGDPSRNWWQLLATASDGFANATNAGAAIQAEIWACPAVAYDGWPWLAVYAALMAVSASDVGSLAIDVFALHGMGNGQLTVDAIRVATATGATSLSIAVPAPPSGTNVVVAAAATDNGTPSAVTATGAGFTALMQVSRSNPNLVMTSQWRTATGATTATWSSGTTSVNWAGVAASFRTTGALPAQPNPHWPITRLLVGLGYQLGTPVSRVWWTDQTSRLIQVPKQTALHAPRGIPYDQGIANSEASTVVIRNDDGAYTPRTAGSATASSAGSTTTIKIPDAQAANIHRGDFFRLATAAGALKELTVFQVTGTSSAGGTTTVTFARADGTAGGAAAATAVGDEYVGIPIDLYIPWRVVAYWQGRWYAVATGWLGELPQSWTDAHWGMVVATGIDALATLTAGNMSPLRGEILRRNPTHYWPCDDPQGTGYAANASGLSNVALNSVQSKFGAGSNNTADFGASTQAIDSGLGFKMGIAGDPGTAWQQTGLTQTDGAANKGYALVARGQDFPSVTNGVTILGTTLGTDNSIGSGSYNCTVVIVRCDDPGQGSSQGSMIKLYIPHPDLQTNVTVWDKTTHAATTTPGPSGTGMGGIASDAQVWAISFNQTSWTAYVSGTSWSGTCNLPSKFTIVNVGGEADQFYNGNCFNGIHNHIAVFPRRLTAGEINAITYASKFAEFDVGSSGATETSSQRIQRKLDTVAWRGSRVITPSPVVMDSEDTQDGSAIAQTAQSIGGSEDTSLFVDALGQFQARSRQYGYYQRPKAVLGDGAAEIPYDVTQVFGFDTTYIYNDVEVDNVQFVGSGTWATQSLVAVDDTSAGRYGQRSLTRTTRTYYAADAWHLGWWLLAKNAYPQLRAATVVIDAASNPNAWAFCLGAEVGDLVTVNRRPLGAPTTISERCLILQVAPDIGPGRALFTLTLAWGFWPVPVCGDTAYGPLGSTVLGA